MNYRWRWEGLGGIQCLPVIIWLEASSKEIRLRTNQTCSKAGNCWLASQFGFASDWVVAPVNPQSSNICLMSVNICLIFVNICLIFVNICLIFVNICLIFVGRSQFGFALDWVSAAVNPQSSNTKPSVTICWQLKEASFEIVFLPKQTSINFSTF